MSSTAPTNSDIPSTTKEQHHDTTRDLPRPLSASLRASDTAQPVVARSHVLRADNNDDANVSEAETDILPEAAASVKRSRKKISLENGGNERRGRDEEDEKRRGNGNGAESPRKKRRRRSRSASESSGSEADDTTFPSDLSSALSSRQTSPSRTRRRMLNESKQLANTKKRKVRANLSSSEDDRPAPQHKLRRRRGSTAVVENPSHSRKPSNTSVGLSPLRGYSPNRSSRPKPQHKQRKIPPRLDTTREKNSEDESNSSSAASSRRGSPARKRRPRSAVPTPGSPVNMSHRPKRDTAGRTHLHRACQRGNVADVEQILEQGTELIHVDDHAGYLPIHEASLNGHVDVVKVLVKHGSPFDKRSTVEQETPLLDAVENGHIEVVKYLLELRANPRKRDKQGRTCLDANKEAWDRDGPEDCRPELDEILRAAISKQRVPRPSDDEQNRASAAPDRDSHSSRDPSVASPVHQSPSAPSVAPVQTIRRRNARAEQSRKDLLWLDSGKGSVIKLREKAREGDAQMVHALLETGLKPDTEALIGAIKGGHTELVSLMLAYAADADPVPGQNERESGRRKREVSMPVGEETPMLAAIGRGNVAILQYLLDNGVDPRRLDNRGRSYADIAREREGEFWQDEVALLTKAWIKAGGSSGKRSTEKSPQRLKTSPPKPAIKRTRRDSSTSSRAQSRPPVKTKEEKAVNRALSVNHLDDSAVVSDRESTAEPLGPPPKNRSGSPRRRRRLVSGKVRAEEEAMAKASDTPRSMDGDKKSVRNPDKVSSKAPKSDLEDTIRVDQRLPKKPKSEPSDDTKMEDAPPLDRRKLKLEREKERERQKPSPAESRQMKRPTSNRDRSRSPPRAPRSEAEKRQELEQLRRRRRDDHPDDRGSRRRDSMAEPDPRKARDERRQRIEGRRGSVSSEPSRWIDDSSRPPKRDSSVANSRSIEDERRRRIREKEGDKADSDRDTKSIGSTEGEKDRAKDIKERKLREKRKDNESNSREDEDANKEMIRRMHLTKELALILKKAAKESKKSREDEVIVRGLALRKLREEEERKMREQEKERKAREAAEKAAKEAQERKRLEQEAAEREARKKEEAERLAREMLENKRKQREAREREEQERNEREAREAEERRLEEEERRKELERQRQEEERRRLEAEERERKLAAEREELRLKEEAERQRLERERLEKERIAEEEEEERKRKAAEEEQKRKELEKEKAEKEASDRKAAEEAQQQIAHEEARRRELEEAAAKEKVRISTLPTNLRIFAEMEAAGLPLPPISQYLPLLIASFCDSSPNSERSATPNGVSQSPEFWVSNVQAALALRTSDLSLHAYPQVNHRPATEHERLRMWSVLKPLLCENITLDNTSSLQERAVSQKADRDRFCALQPVFWLKLADLIPIIAPEGGPMHTVQFTLDIPTGGKGSPVARTRSIKRRSETPNGTPVAKPRTPTTNGPSTNTEALVYSTTMPPPGFV